MALLETAGATRGGGERFALTHGLYSAGQAAVMLAFFESLFGGVAGAEGPWASP